MRESDRVTLGFLLLAFGGTIFGYLVGVGGPFVLQATAFSAAFIGAYQLGRVRTISR